MASRVATAAAPGTYFFEFGGGAYLGVGTANVSNDNASRLGLSEPRGVVIQQVMEDSPASKAGLQKDDVILRFDDEEVTSVHKLTRLVGEMAPDHKVKLRISRAGREQDVTVTVGQRKAPMAWSGSMGEGHGAALGQMNPEALTELRGTLERAQAEGMARGQNYSFSFGGGRRVGISTIALTKQLAEFFGVPGGSGVLITTVNPDSPAAKSGLKAGDVITEVDSEKVDDPGDLSRGINKKPEGDVNFTVIRDRGQRMMTVTPEKGATGFTPFMNERLLRPSVMVQPRILGAPSVNGVPRINITPRTIFRTGRGTVIL